MSAEGSTENIPSGYKKTEAGVIPEDWNAELLGPKVDIKSGESPSLFHFESYGTPYFKVEQLNSNSKYLQNTIYFFRGEKKITRGSLIFPKRGASILLNKIRILEKDSFMDTNLMTLTPKEILHNEFLYYALIHIELWRIADTTSIPQINNKHIIPLVIAFPPTLTEQETIAEALSDADSFIESLKQLTAKKLQIKQGAMQELFCPKQGDEVRLLKEVSSLKGRIGWQGLKQTEFTTNDEEPFLITGMNFKDGAIRWNEVYHISEERYEMASDIQLRPEDVLMTKDGTIGKVLYIDTIPYPGKASLNSHLLLFRPVKGSYNPKYLYYQLCSQRFKNFIEESKSGTTFFGLSQAAVGNYPVLLPPIEEQVNIATLLSYMDSEITALKEKLAKARQIKQGMMQELLTGRIRLL